MFLTREVIRIEAMEKEAVVSSHGAVITFSGIVREDRHSEFGTLRFMEYEAYESMAEKVLSKTAGEAHAKYDAKILIQHRLGELKIGETSLVIVVGSPHRDEAYKVSREVIETIKHAVPIWKREIWERGATWSDGCAMHVQQAS